MNIIGLGNPGEEYANTRHNTGRLVLQMIGKKDVVWKKDGVLNALVCSCELDGKKFKFILPETFMNNSGKSAKPLIKSKKDLEKLVVIYDDIDLPLGRIKISFDRGSGGHNGIESITNTVKSREYARIRVGVAPSTPSGKIRKPQGEKKVHDFLLGDFKDKEIDELKKIAKRIKEALVMLSKEGLGKAMSIFNQ